MARPHPSTAALAAVLGGLLLFVALLSGHCARPILAPHAAAPVASAAVATVAPADAVARPGTPSCILQTPAAVAVTSPSPAHAPQLVWVDASAALALAADVASASASSRAPPPHAASFTIDLCVLRV
jgi:hypothetical protein